MYSGVKFDEPKADILSGSFSYIELWKSFLHKMLKIMEHFVYSVHHFTW